MEHYTNSGRNPSSLFFVAVIKGANRFFNEFNLIIPLFMYFLIISSVLWHGLTSPINPKNNLTYWTKFLGDFAGTVNTKAFEPNCFNFTLNKLLPKLSRWLVIMTLFSLIVTTSWDSNIITHTIDGRVGFQSVLNVHFLVYLFGSYLLRIPIDFLILRSLLVLIAGKITRATAKLPSLSKQLNPFMMY